MKRIADIFRGTPSSASRSGNPTPGQRTDTTHLRLEDGYISEIDAALRDDRRPGWMVFSWGMVAMLVAGICWTAWFEIEEVTSGSARIVPSSREQKLQSLEGGILQELLVHESQTVEKGQVVARIDPTRAEASFNESANRALSLRAQAARLRAESLGHALEFPDEVKANPELLAAEQENYDAKKRALDESIGGYARAKGLVSKELGMASTLSSKGLLSETEVLKLRRMANEADLQIIERRNKYRSEASAELAKVEAELSALDETVASRRDTLDRTEVRSPVRGIVNNIRVSTKGGVIQPGEEIMEVTPLDETLLVETKVKPADMAFLHPGQKAVVKLSAYDYSTYGGLVGKVEYISPSALKDDEAKGNRANADQTYYRVMVRTEGNTLTKSGSEELRIIPGMTATVDILTGKKTLLNYLMRPVLRVQEAFREK